MSVGKIILTEEQKKLAEKYRPTAEGKSGNIGKVTLSEEQMKIAEKYRPIASVGRLKVQEGNQSKKQQAAISQPAESISKPFAPQQQTPTIGQNYSFMVPVKGYLEDKLIKQEAQKALDYLDLEEYAKEQGAKKAAGERQTAEAMDDIIWFETKESDAAWEAYEKAKDSGVTGEELDKLNPRKAVAAMRKKLNEGIAAAQGNETEEWEIRRHLEILATGGNTLYDKVKWLAEEREKYEIGSMSSNNQSYVDELHEDYLSELEKYEAMYGKDKLSSWMDYAERMQNAESMEKFKGEMKAFGDKYPGLAFLISPVTNLGGAAGYVDVLGQNIGNWISGSDTPVDYNTNANIPSVAASSMREGAMKDMGGVGKFLYGTGSSILDSAISFGLGKKGGVYLLGGSAATSTMQNAAARGLSDNQILALGTIAGAAEVVTEKLDFDRFMKIKNADGKIGMIKTILKSSGVEGAEEVVSNIANTLADIWISGDKSEINLKIQKYMEAGLTEEEATQKAWSEWGTSVVTDFLGGAFSGGVFATGGIALNAWDNRSDQKKFGNLIINNPDMVNALIEKGYETDPTSDAYNLADKLRIKQILNQPISAVELGRLAQKTQNATAKDQSADSQTEATEAETVLNSELTATAEGLEVAEPLKDEQQKAAEIGALAISNDRAMSEEDPVMELARETVAERRARDTHNEPVLTAKEQNTETAHIDELIEFGLGAANGTEAHKLAVRLAMKQTRGETISEAEIKRLEKANQKAQKRGKIDKPFDFNIEAPTAVQRADTATETPGAVPFHVMNMQKSSIRGLEALGYRENGTKAMETVLESTGMTVDQAKFYFDTAYEAGLTNVPMEKMTFDNDIQRAAFTAGLRDYSAKQKDLQARSAKWAEYTSVAGKKDAGFKYETADLQRANMTQAEADVVDLIGKVLGSTIGLGKMNVNGKIVGSGDITLDYNYEREVNGEKRNIVFYALHEAAMHRVMQLAPVEGQAFIDAMIRHKNSGLAYGASTETQGKQNAYAKQNVRLTVDKAMEEVSADSIFRLYNYDTAAVKDMIERVANGKDEKAKAGAREYKNALDFIISKLKEIWNKLRGKGEAQVRSEIKKTIDEVEQLRNLLEDALRVAAERVKAEQKNPTSNKKTVQEGGVQYGQKNSPYAGKSLLSDSSVYSYDFLVKLPDMNVVEMPSLSTVKTEDKVDQNKAIRIGMDNAAQEGRKVSDNICAVTNRYTGREIRVSQRGLGHSLDGGNVGRLRTNARLTAIGGSIIKNAVPVNALKSKNNQARGTYAMAALLKSGDYDVVAIVTVEQHTDRVTGIDFVDIAHSINGRLNAKKEGSRSSTRETGFGPATASFTVSIADFLEIVNSTHQSILSDDVLTRLGEQRSMQGYYSERVQYSLKDKDYMAAVNRGDKETAQRMVDEAAKAAGFDVDEDGEPDLLFHGTDTFGFTKIDSSKSDDGISFWATPNMGVAGSYYEGSNYRVREIGREKITPRGKKLTYTNSMEEVVNAAKPFSAELGKDLSKLKYANEATVMKRATKAMQKAVLASEAVLNGNFPESIKRIAKNILNAAEVNTFASWTKAVNFDKWQQYKKTTGVDFAEIDLGDKFNPEKSDISTVSQAEPDVFKMMYYIGDVLERLEVDDFAKLNGETISKQDISLPYNDLVAEKGIYGFYHKQDNPFVYDCGGAAWNKIDVPAEAKGYFSGETVTTRQLAGWAFANGYDAIKLDNVIDVGGYALGEARKPATVWAFKNPGSQIKSADPVTYDDDGKVIPLSQRFNAENEDIRFSLKTEGGTTTVTDKSGEVVAETHKDGTTMFSLKTYREDGRAYLRSWLKKKVKTKAVTQAEADDIIRQLDEFYDICHRFTDKYGTFGAWSEAEVVKNASGKPAFSVVKKNGEYAMNLDFSLVCKKRRTLDAVFREMINRGVMNDVDLGQEQIAKINAIIRESGFETACALCFVDSKRYRQAMVADSFVQKYNELVDLLIPEGSDIKAHHFDFMGIGVKNSGRALHTVPDSELGKGIVKLKKLMQAEDSNKTVTYKIASHLLHNPKDRRHVLRSEFMNTDGFEAVTVKNEKVLGLYNSSKGSGGPKAALSDVRYLGDILKKANFTPARAYAVGGVRIQSFSDYIPRLVFDYLQMIADLAAKKLPAHAYTKEEMFVLQFGMTGIKVNMSLVPAVDPNGIAPGLDAQGNYIWYDGQSFGSDVNVKGSGNAGFLRAIEIQNAAGYSANCGTIAVGISNDHIKKMLDDDNIRMIIPYHKSSLNHIVAVLNNIDQYTDYTKVQNTREKATGSKIEGDDFNYNEALRRLGDAKAAANEYLAWCDKHGYLPKFDEFAGHENYYKLLEDFSTYDNGVHAPQSPVQMIFPGEDAAFGSMAQLIEKGLEEDAVLEGRRQAEVPGIVDRIEAVYREGRMADGVQFSLKEGSSNLAKENAKLKAVNEALREQFKVTKFAKADKKSLDGFTRKLLKDYESGADFGETREMFADLYTYMQKAIDGKTPDTEDVWTEIQKRAYDAAVHVLENAVTIDDLMWQESKEVRDIIRTTRITINKEYDHDLTGYESINEFRKANMGRIRLANDGVPVDTFYGELAEMFPGYFDVSEHTTQPDQLLHIADWLDQQKPTEVNMYSRDMRGAASMLAADIIERVYALPTAKRTYADKMQQKVKDAKAEGKQKAADAYLAGQMSQGRDMAKQIDAAKQRTEAAKEEGRQKAIDAYLAGAMNQGRVMAKQLDAANHAATEAKAEGKQKAADAYLAGMMSQGRAMAKTSASERAALQKRIDSAHEQIAEFRQKVKDVARKERGAKVKAVKDVKDHYRAKEQAMSENRKKSVVKAKIFRHTAELHRDLTQRSKKHHVPEALRGQVCALLMAINTESKYEYVFGVDGLYHRQERGIDPYGGVQTNRTQEAAELHKMYKQIAAEEGLVVDPNLFDSDGDTGNFSKVVAMGDKRVEDMSLEELNTLWSVIRAVEHSIRTANKTLGKAKYAETSEWAWEIKEQTKSFKPAAGGAASLHLQNPYTFFSHYGEAGHAIYRMLRNAQDDQMNMTVELKEAYEKIVDEKTVEKFRNEIHEITTERGDTLYLSTAHIMNIMLLNKRQQAGEHLSMGGIVQPEVKGKDLSGEKVKVKRGDSFVPLTIADLGDIVGLLTPDQTKVATKIQKLTEMLAEWGNVAHETAFGYRKFTGDNYWPIKSAKEGLHSSAENSDQNVRSIKNIGLAKDLKPHANNALDCMDIFDTFDAHAADMIDYAAWLCPMEDTNRLLNFKFKDDSGADIDNMKLLLNRIGGKQALKYWETLMINIQNGINQETGTTVFGKAFNKLYGNSKAASVGANIRVVAQQPTAYIRALAVLDARDLAAGFGTGGGWKKAFEHSAIAKRKAMAGFDISSPYQMGEILHDGRTKIRKFNDASMWMAGKADEIAWGRLWNACEHNVKRTRKELIPGSDAFYDAVDELFTEVIDQTQVVDGVLQRAQVMRASGVEKQLTSFMGEPIMSLNMLIRAHDQLRNAKGDGKKTARAVVARSVVAFLATNAVNAMVQSLIDGLRDDDDDKKYLERVWAAFIGIDGDEESVFEKAVGVMFGGNLGSGLNIAGYIPMLKDAISLVSGYDVSRADAAVMGDVIDAGRTFIDSVFGDGKRSVAYGFKELVHNVSRACGIPATNVIRDVWGITRTIAFETESYPLQYEMEKAIYSTSNQSNNTRFFSILERAYKAGWEDFDTMYDKMVKDDIFAYTKDDGGKVTTKEYIASKMKKIVVDDLYALYKSDTAGYKKLYNDIVSRKLLDTGVYNKDPEKNTYVSTAEAISKTMESRMKDEQGVKKVSELDHRYLHPDQQDLYDKIYGAVTGTKVWKAATEGQREKLEDNLYDLMVGNGAGQNLLEKIEPGETIGIDATEYLLYKLAQEVVSEDGNSNTSQSEAETAIRMITGLSKEEQAWLWESTNKGWKPKNNPFK